MPDRDDRMRSRVARTESASRSSVAACCGWLLLPAAQLVVPSAAWAQRRTIASARMWPAQEYTRVILEATVAGCRTSSRA